MIDKARKNLLELRIKELTKTLNNIDNNIVKNYRVKDTKLKEHRSNVFLQTSLIALASFTGIFLNILF